MAMRIAISLQEHMLNLFEGNNLISSYPVGLGKPQTPTPAGEYVIINKQPNPGGPYGAFWMGLSRPHYGIHGTNSPESIGKNESEGCVRMYNRDVLELASKVPVGTPVSITTH